MAGHAQRAGQAFRFQARPRVRFAYPGYKSGNGSARALRAWIAAFAGMTGYWMTVDPRVVRRMTGR
jgi:hypothetical protein